MSHLFTNVYSFWQQVPLKRRYTSTRLHGVTSQNTVRSVSFSERRRERTATSPTQASRVEPKGEAAGDAV
jgi:hypothetical protein